MSIICRTKGEYRAGLESVCVGGGGGGGGEAEQLD